MNLDFIEYVIVKAGGLGSRMGKFTKNKPKCLIPYKGKTILENLLNVFSNKKIIIISDYLGDVLQNYVSNILKQPDVIFINVDSKTTSTGLKQALSLLNENSSFIYVWSDIIFEEIPYFNVENDILIGVTNNFNCRYSIIDNKITKGISDNNGIFGFFAFKSKSILNDLDESISFVGNNLMKIENKFKVDFINFQNVLEIGTEEIYLNLIKEEESCRFFNKVDIIDNTVIKTCIDSNYKSLIKDEINWYRFLKDKIDFIPKILSVDPLTLSKINGLQLHKDNIPDYLKIKILDSIYDNFYTLHNLDKKEINLTDIEDIYLKKTFDRVNSVKNLIPFFNDEYIKIDNKLNLNPFHYKNINSFIDQIKSIKVNEYNIIHGDPTFSNIIFSDPKCYFIDPRGHFGNTKIYGDRKYDWAKLYYSVNGNYDSINTKDFQVNINKNEVELNIKSNKFEHLSYHVIESSGINLTEMELMHSLIWLSLTGYVKEDIDSVLYSYYKGVKVWNLTL